MKYIKYIAVACGSIIYGLFFAELFLRIASPQGLMPRFVTGSDIGIRQNIPNSRYRHLTPEVDVEMRINSEGMRDDREYSKSKPPGMCRVLLFGDSFFMSYEVSLENSYAKRLEHHLRTAGLKCEVLNFAVSGFGTAESLLKLQSIEDQYEPDYIILEWHQSDVDDNLRSNLYAIHGNSLVRNQNTFLPGVTVNDYLMRYSLYLWALQHSHLYTAIREIGGGQMKKLLVDIGSMRDSALFNPKTLQSSYSRADDTARHTPQDLNSALINEFNRATSRANAKLLLVGVPFQNYLGEFESAFSHLIGEIDPTIAIVDPIPSLKLHYQNGNQVFFHKGHLHFNPDGYDILAKETADSLLTIAKNL